eukprot:gene28380-50224_t
MALVKMEPGNEIVAASLSDGIVSPVIFAECLSKAGNLGHDPSQVERQLLEPGLRIETLPLDDIRAFARLHPLALRNVSLADRFCLSLAMQRKVPLLTADRPWAALGLPAAPGKSIAPEDVARAV